MATRFYTPAALRPETLLKAARYIYVPLNMLVLGWSAQMMPFEHNW